MAPDSNSPKYSLDTVSPKLGSVLQTLFEQGKKNRLGSVPYRKLLPDILHDTGTQEAMLVGALAILRGLGLIHMDAQGGLRGISRHACYALGSLGKFLNASVPAASEGQDGKERDYLISLTKALESARWEKAQLDDEPLHSRRIVNVLIKSRQIRHWKLQDVYLHVYHPQWKHYHLVGLSHRDDSKTDEEIAQLALLQKVGLRLDQYSLDTVFNPPEVTRKLISATSGALTEYTYRLVAVKEIRVKLKLKKLIKEKTFDRNWFRWFTWDEIKQRESEVGEPIMFSAPIVMEQIEDRSSIPTSARTADDVRGSVGILNELSCRFTKKQLLTLVAFLLILPILGFLPHAVALLHRSSPLLDNLSNMATIGMLIIPWGAVLVGTLIALLRKS